MTSTEFRHLPDGAWWTNVSVTNLSHIDYFTVDADPEVMSSKYWIDTLANTGDNGDPIAKSSTCRYNVRTHLEVCCFHRESQHLHQIEIQVRSSNEESAANLSRTPAKVLSVGTFVNRLTTSRPTICLNMNGSISDLFHEVGGVPGIWWRLTTQWGDYLNKVTGQWVTHWTSAADNRS